MSVVIPNACTLPTAERPARLAEFDDLFAAAVRRVEAVTPCGCTWPAQSGWWHACRI